MRVIAGTARHLVLQSPAGVLVRPTTDRIKETLFNILSPLLPGSVFVDAFAGSGQIGIEALSRGARRAYFIENHPAALACIRANLEKTGMTSRAELLRRDAPRALGRIPEHIDLIFADPPYESDLASDLIRAAREAACVGPDTLLVVEARLDADFRFAGDLGFQITREKRYKTNKHIFLQKK